MQADLALLRAVRAAAPGPQRLRDINNEPPARYAALVGSQTQKVRYLWLAQAASEACEVVLAGVEPLGGPVASSRDAIDQGPEI